MKFLINLLETAGVMREKKTPWGVTVIYTNDIVVAVDNDFLEKTKESANGKTNNTKRDRQTRKS